jgi:Trk K+ transport system NAD-binding subunit
MRVIVVGAGSTTRAVLERLGERWDVVVVDQDAERLARLVSIRPVETVEGDGTSRLVLQKAGLEAADALVVAMDDDESGLEVCRLASAAGIDRIVAVAAGLESLAEYRRAGVTAISPDRLASRHVEINLEPRRVTSAAFAAGRAEAVEFRISPDSPLRGRALQDVALQGWLVAAVLRDDELIVPNGRTQLQTNDLVTIVGPAGDHAAMVATFTGGLAHFPQPYGRDVAVILSDAADADALVREAAAMTRLTAGGSLVLVREGSTDEGAPGRPPELFDRAAELAPGVDLKDLAVPTTDLAGLGDLRLREGVGLVVLRKPTGRLRTVRVLEAIRRAGTAALLVGGTYPYAGIVAPARDSIAGWSATWVAIDLAARAKVPLEALGVVPPSFVAGEHEEADIRRAVARIRDEASVQGVDVSGRTETGNPVRIFRALPADRLLVLGLGRQPYDLLRPGITGHIVAGIEASVVVVPDRIER